MRVAVLSEESADCVPPPLTPGQDQDTDLATGRPPTTAQVMEDWCPAYSISGKDRIVGRGGGSETCME